MTNLSLASDRSPERSANPLLRGFARGLDLEFGNGHPQPLVANATSPSG